MESQERSLLPRPIARLWIRGVSNQTRDELLSRIPIHLGEMLTDELLERALRVGKTIHEALEAQVGRGMSLDEYSRLPEGLRKKVPPPAADDGVNVTSYDVAGLPQRIRVEAADQDARLIEKVAPVCATQPGAARLTIVVGKDGSVVEAKPLDGPESIAGLAADAVRAWRYRPTLLNGFPVEVQTTVEVRFE